MKARWQTKKLGELCRIRTGKKDVNQGNPEGKYPFFTCAAEHTYSDSFSFDTEALLIAGNGNVGQVSYYNGKFEAYQRTYVISDFSDVQSRYLFLILDGKLTEAVSKQKLGNTMPYIKIGMLTDFLVPIPPLPEQHRIAAIIDEAFDGIATAKANAEKNLQNVRNLFLSGYATAFAQSLCDGYERLTVADMAMPIKGAMRTGPFGSQLLHSEFVDQGIAVLGIDNAVNNEFRWDKRRYITEEKYRQLSRYQVKPGDVLITIMGTCGRCAVVPDDIPVAINTKHLCCITLDPEKCSSGFLHGYFLYHPEAQQFLAARAQGSIMAGLNMGIISELPVLLPPLKQQHALVSKIATLRAETQRLESIYQQKLAALDELKQSLLHQAFSGNL